MKVSSWETDLPDVGRGGRRGVELIEGALRSGSDDVGDLQSGKVECLTRRNAGYGVLAETFGQGGERRVVMSFIDQLTMNLVCHNEHPVMQADVTDAPQFLRRPDPSDRIVRIT